VRRLHETLNNAGWGLISADKQSNAHRLPKALWAGMVGPF
jgi:hypothetical protein